MIVVLIIAGLAAVVIISVAPFFLPWPQRLRWLVAASNVPDPWGLAATPWPGLDEMTVTAVISCPGGLLVDGHSGPPGSAPQSFWLEGATAEMAARLEWSAAIASSLLQRRAAGGDVTLYGPTWAVSGLRSIPEPEPEPKPRRPVATSSQ